MEVGRVKVLKCFYANLAAIQAINYHLVFSWHRKTAIMTRCKTNTEENNHSPGFGETIQREITKGPRFCKILSILLSKSTPSSPRQFFFLVLFCQLVRLKVQVDAGA